MSGLPTRDEMLSNALAELTRARLALSRASEWLSSDWRPLGSSLTNDQADARSVTRKAIGDAKAALNPAEKAIRAALEGGTR